MEITRPTRLLLSTLSVVTVIGAWWLVAGFGLVNAFLLPSPLDVVNALLSMLLSGQLLVRAFHTLTNMLLGFAIAAVAGLAIGVGCSRSRIMRWIFDPLLSIGLPTPKIAFMPIFMLWFGVFDELVVALVAFNAIFLIISSTWSAIDQIDEMYVWSARSMGASPRQVLFDIVLPAATPAVLTGLQVALPLSLIVAIVTEIATASSGLGGMIIHATRLADSPAVFAGVVAVGLLGFAILKSMEIIRRRMLVWSTEAE